MNEELRKELREDNHREDKFGEYHPSTITGCPLKAVLDRMTDASVELNSYMFAGTAVHYYLQETGILTDALYRAGYHPLYTDYEVSTRHKVDDGIFITGTCDIICDDGDNTTIIDIKYSSLKPEYAHGRVAKYFAQVNTYSKMFDADEMALWLISSNERDSLPDEGISMLTGEPQEDNWEITKDKARSIHNTLERYGYPDGNTFDMETLAGQDLEFWQELLGEIDLNQVPAYEKECKYCDHSEYCPVKQGEMGGGMQGVVNKAKNGSD